MVRNGFLCFFLLPWRVRNRIVRVFFRWMVRNGIPTFSLPRNCSERNSERFPFRETDGTLTEKAEFSSVLCSAE
jgi:hypothetical protein